MTKKKITRRKHHAPYLTQHERERVAAGVVAGANAQRAQLRRDLAEFMATLDPGE